MASALKTWELENAVTLTDPTRDALYTFDAEAQKAAVNAKPWKPDPRYFSSIRISAVALLKMTMHAREGGSNEIMGLMQGYISGRSIIVTNAFRLPVEGTETRVNAQEDANEYMVTFPTAAREAGQMENAVGWYHSHPGYGCWLSGIDVSTQATHQMFNDPFVAVVIDPDRTISAGKVEIGAFRTFPGALPGSGGEEKKDGGVIVDDEDDGEDADGFQSIPLGKIEDFGAYADKYYSLEVSHFKSSLDTKLLEALWNKYWVSTLAASPLLTNREYGTRQIADLAMKVKQHADGAASRARSGGGPQLPGGMMGPMSGAGAKKEKQREEQLEKIVNAGKKIAMEEESGLMAGEIKEKLFAGLGHSTIRGA